MLAMIAAASSVMAQDRQQEGGKDFKPIRTPMEIKTRFGLMAGINESKFWDKNVPAATNYSTNMRTSFHVGGFVNVPLGGSFRLQPGLVFSGQGADVNVGSGSSSVSYDQSLHYINIPILLQLQTKSGFYLQTGPQPGFLVSAKYKPNSGASTNNKDNFDTFDFAWNAGIGYLTRIGLGLNAQYNYGITNILANKSNTSSTGELKNRVIQLGLVYHFGAAK